VKRIRIYAIYALARKCSRSTYGSRTAVSGGKEATGGSAAIGNFKLSFQHIFKHPCEIYSRDLQRKLCPYIFHHVWLNQTQKAVTTVFAALAHPIVGELARSAGKGGGPAWTELASRFRIAARALGTLRVLEDARSAAAPTARDASMLSARIGGHDRTAKRDRPVARAGWGV